MPRLRFFRYSCLYLHKTDDRERQMAALVQELSGSVDTSLTIRLRLQVSQKTHRAFVPGTPVAR